MDFTGNERRKGDKDKSTRVDLHLHEPINVRVSIDGGGGGTTDSAAIKSILEIVTEILKLVNKPGESLTQAQIDELTAKAKEANDSLAAKLTPPPAG